MSTRVLHAMCGELNIKMPPFYLRLRSRCEQLSRAILANHPQSLIFIFIGLFVPVGCRQHRRFFFPFIFFHPTITNHCCHRHHHRAQSMYKNLEWEARFDKKLPKLKHIFGRNKKKSDFERHTKRKKS